MTGHISRILIANRGEIAIRIARAASALGIETVGVHAAADQDALHTRTTTESALLEGSDPIGAYLDIDNVVAAARSTGCDAVHPGYGFLSENAAFAQACADAGLSFIGPSAEAIGLFGDKARAKALAVATGVPVILGSDGAVSSAATAQAAADAIGYPVMLKAAAGGGGRGMRRVDAAADLGDAFVRCQSEAQAAFGSGAVLVEKLLVDPRHIEVQVLADAAGQVVHVHERDCSVQQRNQKVIEIAPAPNLDADLRERILADAVALAAAGQYRNAGTVEFLVTPEDGSHYFIEMNPRIQVEHTITEEVAGLDLVEAQIRIAGGATLADLGLADQEAVPEPRGFAVQARVVMTSPGTITGYKEPNGPGVRVDAHGYLGYSPSPQFDPLLAKVIGSGPSLVAALERTSRSLADFHLEGIGSNIDHLRQLLARKEVRGGDARTTLVQGLPTADGPRDEESSALPEFLSGQAVGARSALNGVGVYAPLPLESSASALVVGPGQVAITCPMEATLVAVLAEEGAEVAAGDAIAVVNAMKMETVIEAPRPGTIASLQELRVGDPINADQIVAVLAPSDDGAQRTDLTRENSWQPTLDEVEQLQGLAHARLAPGSDDPGVVRQRSRNKLTCRERIDLLLDGGSFREVGSLAGFASYDEFGEVEAFTPANSVGGQGLVDGRSLVVCADDFTSRGGHSDGAIGAKSLYLDRLSIELGIPSVRMLDGSSGGGSVASMVPEQKKDGDSSAKESTGAIKAGRPRVAGGGGSFLPGHLGSTMYARQLANVPVVNMLLGSVVGLGAAKAVLGHFSVMVRDVSQLFVAGPPVVSHAVGYEVTKEELGGWHIHCRNGSVDNLAESEEEAVDMAQRFLSYLPPNVNEVPPVLACSDPVDRREEELFTIIPRRRTTTFDIRRAIELMADEGSFFEIGPLWGTDQVTGLARFNGHPVGIIASDSRHVNAGALTADGCDKLTRHLDLCDLFNIPVLNLVDNPGFTVGIEHELAGTIRKGATWMVAFAQTQVPIFTVLMRRSFGVAGNNYATPRSQPNARVVWPAADTGGIPPEGGIEAAYKRQLAEADDPAALRAELEARIESARGPVGPLSKFQIEEMIDPRDTRRHICEWIPSAYKVVSRPNNLGPRAIGYRP